VGGEILARGGRVLLLVSQKEVDQRASEGAAGFEIVALPAIGLTRSGWRAFARGFYQSWGVCRKLFGERKPAAVLAMGGFTSAPPILAGWLAGTKTFLHEANTLPGRANRWLARFSGRSFVYFSETAGRLKSREVEVSGMPVRTEFQRVEPGPARMVLGLRPGNPVLLAMGGSQGASRINELVCKALPVLRTRCPDLQYIHLTGMKDIDSVAAVYNQAGAKAVVRPFLTEMELALGAATLAVSRSGASSLAEFAAMGIPAILIPYPAAADDHQYFNALSFAESGAAMMFEQRFATPSFLAERIISLLADGPGLSLMREKMAARHLPEAAPMIAERILSAISPEVFSGEPSPVRAEKSFPLRPGAA
jgi:UDP-N-acetylglucosamine--N-acetylmuramyl-(pentapeptide) pyrophosphoryl-undecaprenol N-acetylglucosamine transferase